MRSGLLCALVYITVCLCCMPCLATTVNKIDGEVSVSANGRVVVFGRGGDEGVSSIIVHTAGKTTLTSLTKGPIQFKGERRVTVLGRPLSEDAYSPAVSANGRFVAWEGYALCGSIRALAAGEAGGDGGSCNLYVTDLSTGSSRRLTSCGGAHLIWSPDGRRVGYVTPRGELRAVDVVSRKTKVLCRKLPSAERLAWLSSGPAIAVRKDDKVAWFSIRESGALTRTSRFLRLPQGKAANSRQEAWALGADARTAVYAGITYNAIRTEEGYIADNVLCTIYRVTSEGAKAVARIDGSRFSSDAAIDSRSEIVLARDGRTFVLSIEGGIWKGDLRTGSVEQITKPMSGVY